MYVCLRQFLLPCINLKLPLVRCSSLARTALWTPRRTRGCLKDSKDVWTQSCLITKSFLWRLNIHSMQRLWNWQSQSLAASSTLILACISHAAMVPPALVCPLVVSSRKYSKHHNKFNVLVLKNIYLCNQNCIVIV